LTALTALLPAALLTGLLLVLTLLILTLTTLLLLTGLLRIALAALVLLGALVFVIHVGGIPFDWGYFHSDNESNANSFQLQNVQPSPTCIS
jgi:hypothetical protein